MEINRASQAAAGRLGEIVNGARSSTYFTKPAAAGRQRKVYFYFISIVFPSNYFTKQPAAAGISTLYLVHCTWYFKTNSGFLRPPLFQLQVRMVFGRRFAC